MSWLTRAISVPPSLHGEPKLAVDGFIDSYLTWRDACDDLRSAYGHWRDSKLPHRRFAFEGYRAALDREEHAARVHARWAQRLLASVG